MLGVRKILVGVAVSDDMQSFPEATQAAIDRALWLAEQASAEVTLMSVLAGPDVETEAIVESSDDESPPWTLVQNLHGAVIAEAETRGLTVRSLITRGRDWMELIREVIRNEFDVIVVGTRSRTAAAQLFFGSTTVKLIRKCPCPVWVTRPGAFDNEIPTVLAADDLGPVGEKVLQAAVGIAQASDSRLLVLHACHYPLEAGLFHTEASEEVVTEYRDKVRQEAEVTVQERLAKTDYRTISQGTQIEIATGRPDTVIEQACQDHDISLLVMGTIGRGGIPGLLVGNTAERLLPQLRCSILALKPDGFQCPVTLPQSE